MKKALAGVGLVLLAMAPSAMASGEIADPCSVAAIGTPPNAYPEPTVPWLDLCDTDVAGFDGAGSMRGIRVTFHLAGDLDMRAGSAAYAALLSTSRCSFQIQYTDLGVDTATNSSRVQGACDVPMEPCPILSEYTGCWQTNGGGQEFDLQGSPAVTTAISSGLTASTVTLTFDPNKATVPPALADALAPGAVISNGEAVSFARAGAAAYKDEAAYDVVDFAFGDGPIALG